MYGSYKQGATITLSYFDEGVGKIYMQYNSDDPTLSGNTAYKTIEIGEKSNSNAWKTITVKIIDAAFSNAQDSPYLSDFRIYSPNGLGIKNIKVLARV